MTQRHTHADLIIAWANGAQIQYYRKEDGEWLDVAYPNWSPYCRYRIKLANVVRWLPVALAPDKTVVVGFGVTSKDFVHSQTDAATELKAVLRIEINPDTLELVSATMEAP